MRVPIALHSTPSAMGLLHTIPPAFMITETGPARYVITKSFNKQSLSAFRRLLMGTGTITPGNIDVFFF